MKGKRRFRKGKILLLISIAILIAGVVAARTRQSGKDQIDIQTAAVQRGTVTSSVSGNGVLQPVTTVEVRSNAGGQVVELAVDEGDVVKSGQLIARIDPSDSISVLQQAQADFAGASAKVEQAKQGSSMQRLQTAANIDNAEQSLEANRQRLEQAKQQSSIQPKLTEEAIRQAQSNLDSAQSALNQTRSALIPQKLASAKAAYDQAKASYDQAEKNVGRQRALMAKGYVSNSQVDEAETQYSTAKAQLENAKSKLDTVKDEAEQDLRNAESKVAQAKSALETARANSVQDTIKRKELAASQAALKQARAALASARASAYQDQMKNEEILQAQAQLERSKASVKNAQTQLGYTTVVAPRPGVVVKKYVEEGSIVTAGKQAIGGGSGAGITIVEIADVSTMRVVVNVDETDVARIALDQEVDVSVDAYPDEIFTAKVIKIAPKAVVDQNVTTVPVTVEIEDADARLKPEMNATCDFICDRVDDVLYVPVEAVTETNNGAEVTVMDHDKQVVRKVQIGLVGDEYCETVSGLKEGENVVIPLEESKQSNSGPRPGGPPPF